MQLLVLLLLQYHVLPRLPLKSYARTWISRHHLSQFDYTCNVFPAKLFRVIWITKVSRIENVNIALVDYLGGIICTLLVGLLKKLSQFSAWSNASGKKIRLGLSFAVDLMWMPLSFTFLESTSSGSTSYGWYFLGCGWLLRNWRRLKISQGFSLWLILININKCIWMIYTNKQRLTSFNQ